MFNDQAFLGMVPLVSRELGQYVNPYPVEYPHWDQQADLDNIQRARAAGDEEMARYYEDVYETRWGEPPPSPPPFRNYTTRINPPGRLRIPFQPPPPPPPVQTPSSQPFRWPPSRPYYPPYQGMVPSVDTRCPAGQFWDGRQCRGSVASGFGQFGNLAFQPGSTTTFAMSGAVRLVDWIGTRALQG